MTPSPCINVCKMDATNGLCIGCYRTIDEIALWSRFDETARRQVHDAIAERRAQYPSLPTPPQPAPVR